MLRNVDFIGTGIVLICSFQIFYTEPLNRLLKIEVFFLK